MRSACKLCARQARLLLHQSQQQQLISGQAAPSTTLRRWQSTATSPRKASVQQPESSASTSSTSSLSGLLSRFTPSSSSSSSADDAQPNNFKINLVNPAKLLGGELASMRSNIQKLLGSGHPALDTIAKYYFQAEGKHIRPLIVLLMSQATNPMTPTFAERLQRELSNGRLSDTSLSIDDPLEVRPDVVLSDTNPSMTANDLPFSIPSPSPSLPTNNVLPSQRRLAEITEMIHVASLLHDDVIDASATRRSSPSAPAAFGNKLSILGGDFLLARASLYLSRLGSNEVVELVASVLANLVEGEVMQIKGNAPESSGTAKKLTPEIFEHYMRKTYLKTASLIAKSCRATTVLGGAGIRQGWPEGERVKDAAYAYGRNLGIAFQLVDDMLDFTGSEAGLGKPSQGADLKLGLATAPALYAWEEFPDMGEMILRKFENEGDVEKVRALASCSALINEVLCRPETTSSDHQASHRQPRSQRGMPS